jgi:transcription antitermination protein NusB
MISRRNIRVKVMQTLYAVETTAPEINVQQALSILDKHLEQSRQIFTYLVYFLTEVARYAETDARLRASKHLPSAEDLKVNTKISGNELLWKIVEDSGFQEAVSDYKLASLIDKDQVRKVYNQTTESPQYQEYISLLSRDKKDEKQMLEFIFTDLMLPNEDLTGHLEELFIHWDDDGEMMNLMMLNFLQKPGSYKFMELISKEKLDFAKGLVKTSMEKKEYTLEIIKPKLKNWDADRIALLDMILMRMGTCEFLYFETIPAKVTLNEYIDLAKDYSTPQSGHFVNGILDNIHKELTQENKLRKVDYKKQ